MSDEWRFEFRVVERLPPLFWTARVRKPDIAVTCGTAVRRAADAFLEGTWAGGPELRDVAESATVYATGIVLTARGPLIVPHFHTQDGVYSARRDGTLYLANSFAGLLATTSQRLDPDFDYPDVFWKLSPLNHLVQAGQPKLVVGRRFEIPTLDGPVEALFCENYLIDQRGEIVDSSKPREPRFVDFDDYRARIHATLRSLFANAAGYTPLATLSSGYDSTAVAAVAAAEGCRRAVGVSVARRHGDNVLVDDSGEATARRLGLEFTTHDRSGYLRRADTPEAEFLSTGATGEDIYALAFETELKHTLLLTGFWGGQMFHGSRQVSLTRMPTSDLSGSSLTDYRLRADFIHLPLLYFGALQTPTTSTLADDPTMDPYRVGGSYDRPIARRLAEDAGLPRGTFARSKVAGSQLLHGGGRSAFAPATAVAIERFAAAEHRQVPFGHGFTMRSRHRAAIKLAHWIRVGRLVRGLEHRRERAVHFESQLGTILLRWAVSVVAPRYRV